MTKKERHERLLKIPMRFDEAMKRTMQVKPPPEGWAEYEKKLKRDRKRKRAKSAA